MRKTRPETDVSKYVEPTLLVFHCTNDVLTSSGEVTWCWSKDFEQSRENTWQGVEG